MLKLSASSGPSVRELGGLDVSGDRLCSLPPAGNRAADAPAEVLGLLVWPGEVVDTRTGWIRLPSNIVCVCVCSFCFMGG